MVRFRDKKIFSDKAFDILKRILIVSFLLIYVEGDKVDVFIWMVLLIAPFNSGVEGLLYLLPIISVLYLFYSTMGASSKKFNRRLSLLAILSLLLFVLSIEMYSGNGHMKLNWSHFIYFIISSITTLQIFVQILVDRRGKFNQL